MFCDAGENENLYFGINNLDADDDDDDGDKSHMLNKCMIFYF